ncbi:MAG: SusD/RagB family nutrient-binding outer membrane lipoprotein [Ignavibacteriaceae bacterium]
MGVAEGLTGQALIETIMMEKYISNFMNPETYNDWKRTNLPVLITYNGKAIPRRFYYSTEERNANPNIPLPSQQPLRNENDPGDNY